MTGPSARAPWVFLKTRFAERWARFSPDGTLMAAPMRVRGAELLPGAPVPLFRPRILRGGVDAALGPQYDVSRDGRFLVNAVTDDTPMAPITLIQNWNQGANK